MIFKFMWLFIFSLVDSSVCIKVLKLRGISINNIKKISILFIVLVSTIWSAYYIDNYYEQLKVLLILPIIVIISLIDVKEKIVYDEDIICGIILEIAVLVMAYFSEFSQIINKNYHFRAFNIVKMIFSRVIWVFIYGEKSFFTDKGAFENNFEAFLQLESICRDAVSYALYSEFFNYGVYFNRTFYGSILGMAVMFAVSGIISELTGALGTGDVLYFALLGMFSNICGCFIIFFTSFAVCAIYCIISIIIFNKDFEDGLISFTPFISVGFIIFCCVAV